MAKSWVKRIACGVVLAALIIFLGACGSEGLSGSGSAPAPASISGQVISRTSGATLQDVPVRIGSIIVHTDRLGSFTVHNLLPGDYSVTVEAEGYEDYTQTIHVSGGGNDLGQIALFDLPPDPPVL